jgi:hypothetical protein
MDEPERGRLLQLARLMSETDDIGRARMLQFAQALAGAPPRLSLPSVSDVGTRISRRRAWQIDLKK